MSSVPLLPFVINDNNPWQMVLWWFVLKKSEGTFYYSYISGDEFISFDGFSLIPKTRRRGKLQSLQFYINSKTKGP